MNIRIWNYGNYSSDNYGSCRAVSIGRVTLYFSYDTVVAYNDLSDLEDGLVIRENAWSTTTGRHLNCINEDHKIRIRGAEFEKKLEKMLKKHKLD